MVQSCRVSNDTTLSTSVYDPEMLMSELTCCLYTLGHETNTNKLDSSSVVDLECQEAIHKKAANDTQLF